MYFAHMRSKLAAAFLLSARAFVFNALIVFARNYFMIHFSGFCLMGLTVILIEE